MSVDRSIVVNSEAPFEIDELFFSRTDQRGVIFSANAVFQRISHYSWDNLHKAPHRLIRHPDMPRGVFQLMWDTIKAGRPIGAYVKNRASDGRFYWVFAVVTPTVDGFLSVRLKPTSDLLDIVRETYAAIQRREAAGELSPEQSARALLAALADLGFASYAEFMAVALARESAARDSALGRPADAARTRLTGAVASMKGAQAEAEAILAAFTTVEMVPYNMRLQSSRLGDAAGPLSEIASNYQVLSGDVRNSVNEFAKALDAVSVSVVDALFLQDTALVQSEVAAQFAGEKGLPDWMDADMEARALEAQRTTYVIAAEQGLRQVAAAADALERACNHMRWVATGLEVTRVMCKIETARVRAISGSMGEIIEELGRFQETVARALAEIGDLNELLRTILRTRPAQAA